VGLALGVSIGAVALAAASACVDASWQGPGARLRGLEGPGRERGGERREDCGNRRGRDRDHHGGEEDD
jgi:hypothetical protein